MIILQYACVCSQFKWMIYDFYSFACKRMPQRLQKISYGCIENRNKRKTMLLGILPGMWGLDAVCLHGECVLYVFGCVCV